MQMNDKKSSMMNQTIWSSLSGILASLEAVITTMVVSRFIGIFAAGELTIAFAFGNLFRTIGLWGTRNYQVSDQKREFSFSDYLKTRFYTMLIMGLVIFLHSLYLLLFRHTDSHKLLVIVLIELVYFVEAFEDVIAGEYQRRGRLDIGAKIFIIRWASLLLIFSIGVVCFKSFLPVLGISVLVSLVIFFITIFFIYSIPNDESGKNSKRSIFLSDNQKKLFFATFPLFVISFLIFFMNNVAKYSMDYYFDDGLQACFGFITLPVFAVELFSWFIYQPKLKLISCLWIENNIRKFRQEIIKQVFFILGITIACILGGFWLGIPVLSIFFSADLAIYRLDLLINIAGGGAIAYIVYASTVLTVMRKQKIQLIIYGVTTVIGGTIIWELVRCFGIRGASMGNFIVFFVQAVIMYIAIFILERLPRNGSTFN